MRYHTAIALTLLLSTACQSKPTIPPEYNQALYEHYKVVLPDYGYSASGVVTDNRGESLRVLATIGDPEGDTMRKMNGDAKKAALELMCPKSDDPIWVAIENTDFTIALRDSNGWIATGFCVNK